MSASTKQWIGTVTAGLSQSGDPEMVVTTSALDRAGDRVIPGGADLTAFKRCPVLLWSHNHDLLPIGSVTAISTEPTGIRTSWRWNDGDELGARVKQGWEGGFIRGASIGFLPTETRPNSSGGQDYTRWQLIEVSLCCVPCNPEAVRHLKALGLWRAEDETVDVAPGDLSRVVRECVREALGAIVARSVRRAIDRARGRVIDPDIDLDAIPARPRQREVLAPSKGVQITLPDVPAAQLAAMVRQAVKDSAQQVLRRSMEGSIQRGITTSINRLRGRVD